MRLKSNIITITYAGQDILLPGQFIAADSYGLSRSYSTAAEPIVDAAAPVIRSHGNAQGTKSLPICIDLASEPKALAEAMRRMAFVEANPVGLLTVTVGEGADKCVTQWDAGISSTSVALSYSTSGVRLTFTYDFILGACVSVSD